MEVDVEPCSSAGSKDGSIKALINSFFIPKNCEPTFMRKCELTIRPLSEGEEIDATNSVIDLPIQYLERLLFRTKFYKQDPLNENECVDIYSSLIFSNNPFVSYNFNPIVVLQDIILKPNQQHLQQTTSLHFYYYVPPHAIHHLAEYCPFGVEIIGSFDPFNYIVFKNFYSENDVDFHCQQAAKIMAACRNNELYFHYSTNVFLRPLPLMELDCGLSIYEGFEMKPTKQEEKDDFLGYQICCIQKVFFTPLPLNSAIEKCFKYPEIRKAFSSFHHCLSFTAQTFKNTAFDICELKIFDETAKWNPDENLYKISMNEKFDISNKEMIHLWGPKYLNEHYSSKEFQIVPFQECPVNFWPVGVGDIVNKLTSESPKRMQQKISKLIDELNFLNKENAAIKPDWNTHQIEILQFPSILFRTESVEPKTDGKFGSESNIPIIYGTKISWIILYSNETYLQLFKHVINSMAITLSYRSIITVTYRKIKNSLQLHSEIIKCNTAAEMLITIDGGNSSFSGCEETVAFAKTKNPDAAVFVLKLKDLKKVMNEGGKELEKLKRILNLKMGGLNHTPNYAKFLSINSLDVKPNEILFLSYFFLPSQSSKHCIATSGFAFSYMPIKCQPIGKIAFQYTNRTQFYTIHKFCEFLISKIEQQGVYFPKIVFIGTIDSSERDEICEFNAKMDLNIIQKHFMGKPILVYLSFTREHTFRALADDGNLPIGACIDEVTDENVFYLMTQTTAAASQPMLKVEIHLNQPGISKASIKHYIFTQCFCNQISFESDPFPSTLIYSMKLAQKGVKVIEALKKHSPASFTGNAEDDAIYCNKAIAFQNVKYQSMDIDGDNDIENEKKIVKSRKISNNQ